MEAAELCTPPNPKSAMEKPWLSPASYEIVVQCTRLPRPASELEAAFCVIILALTPTLYK